MGLVEKPAAAADGRIESFAGVTLRPPLRPINAKPPSEEERKPELGDRKEEEQDQECPATPKAAEARIPPKLACPPAPRKRKRKRPLKCCGGGGGGGSRARAFFNPPDLETVFLRHA